MGNYDSIYGKCPSCGYEIIEQSKSGECILNEYPMNKVPTDVVNDANRHSPFLCNCGKKLRFEICHLNGEYAELILIEDI